MDVYGIEALLGVPEFRVVNQVIHPQRFDVHLQRRANSIVCPRCQACCWHVQGSRSRCLRDLPILERPVVLWLHLRRSTCHDCHHRPWEKNETFGAQVQWTERLYQHVRQDYLHGCPCRELARRYDLSERTVCRWTFERSRGGRPRQLSRAISIDEYSRRKGHRYNTLLVDLERGQPLTTFKGRRAEEVIAWFKSRPQTERERVEVVVVDMSKTYCAAIKEVFGEQVQVIDRFHVIQQAVSALEEVWRSVQKQLDAEEAKTLKKLRKHWLKAAKQLDVDELIGRYEWRRRLPQLREIIDWGQDLRR